MYLVGEMRGFVHQRHALARLHLSALALAPDLSLTGRIPQIRKGRGIEPPEMASAA